MTNNTVTAVEEMPSLMDEIRKVAADRVVFLTILVSAFGYFVDIFDLLMFNILRVSSLKDLGVYGDDLLTEGVFLLNTQMAGLILGGLFWGILGDKFGRVSVLFGSIILYSAGNIANAFVQDIHQYALARFATGLGLAGELGIGITLASELLPQRIRGLGTTMIVGIGILGACAAALTADLTTWRHAYIIGGVMGLLLLVLRIGVKESGMYEKAEANQNRGERGNLWIFFKRFDLLKRYIAVVLIGAPIWGVIAIFFTFAPEVAAALGMSTPPSAGTAVLFGYAGQAVGDTCSGLVSQRLQSRRKSATLSLLILICALTVVWFTQAESTNVYYVLCFILGIGAGYWTMFVQMGAEQFGTNIRATAATSIPNVVRGLTIPMTLAFKAMKEDIGILHSAMTVMGVIITLAFISLWFIRETFHVDLDYTDGHKK